MQDSLHSYMKVGIVHPMAFPNSTRGAELVATVRRIAEDEFFGSIEVGSTGEVTEEVAGILKLSKLVVGFAAQPGLLAEKLDLNSIDPKVREAAITRAKSAIDEALLLGATKLAVLSGPCPAPERIERAKNLLVDSLLQICTYAKDTGNIDIVLEIFDRDIDKKCLIGPTKDAVQVALEVRKAFKKFGLMVDLSHLPLLRETSDFALRTAKDYLVHAHIGNCLMKEEGHPAYGDKHPPFGTPGSENDVDELKLFLKALMSIGYIGKGKQNVVAFEVKPLAGQSPEMVIANAKRTLLEAWARLESQSWL
jgi:sugar phosphate isomerase/epimerase